MNFTRIAWLAVLVLALPARAADPPPDEATRAAMREIFDSLAEILPRALASDGFESPAEREAIRTALARLAGRADTLARHGGASGAGFELMGRSLARDAREAEARFASGRNVDARYVTLRLTESCVACHSRQPSDRDAPFAAGLIERAEAKGLDPHERARLAVATRQFDRALDLLEALLTSPPPPEGDASRGADLDEYLIVVLRVKRDSARADRLLAKLEARPETSSHLRRLCGVWRAALAKHGAALREEPSLARARALVESGRSARSYTYSRAGLVQDLIASSQLHRLLDDSARGLGASERAEAYYLLGLTDAQVRSSPWLSDAEHYLTTAIRTAPHSAVAARAFEAYEDMVVLDWTGSGGTRVPDDVARELDRLRVLAGPEAS